MNSMVSGYKIMYTVFPLIILYLTLLVGCGGDDISQKIEGEWKLQCLGPTSSGTYVQAKLILRTHPEAISELRSSSYSDAACTQDEIVQLIYPGKVEVGRELLAPTGETTYEIEVKTEEVLDSRQAVYGARNLKAFLVDNSQQMFLVVTDSLTEVDGDYAGDEWMIKQNQ